MSALPLDLTINLLNSHHQFVDFCLIFSYPFFVSEPVLVIYFYFFVSLGPHPWHMEVSRLRVESELQPLAYARATAT